MQSTKSDDLKALDAARSRIAAVVKSLEAIDVDLQRYDPLPNWPSLQKSSALLLRNITNLLSTTTAHNDALRALHSYPLPTFPGRSQEALLQGLLRKKLEPDVEDWIGEGLVHASRFCEMGEFAVGKVASHTEGGLDEYALSELWEWAGPAENDIARQVLFSSGDDDEEEDDEDEDDEDETGEGVTKDTAMTDVAAKDNEPPRLPLATVLTFMSTGAVPKVVDRAKQEQDMQAAMKQMQNQRAAEEMERRIGRG